MSISASTLAALSHAGMRWNSPLSAEHADLLLDRLELASATDVLDLGSGWGELLLRALERAPDLRGVGVDREATHLERARRAARDRALAGRVAFLEGDAATHERGADRVICLGASQAWGGTGAALDGLRRNVHARGRCLFGEGFWATPPSPEARAIFGELNPSLSDLVASAIAAAWRPLHVDVASPAEWDDFESSFRRGLELFALQHPDDPMAPAARARADARRKEYFDIYRGTLGFAYLVLARGD